MVTSPLERFLDIESRAEMDFVAVESGGILGMGSLRRGRIMGGLVASGGDFSLGDRKVFMSTVSALLFVLTPMDGIEGDVTVVFFRFCLYFSVN